MIVDGGWGMSCRMRVYEVLSSLRLTDQSQFDTLVCGLRQLWSGNEPLLTQTDRSHRIGETESGRDRARKTRCRLLRASSHDSAVDLSSSICMEKLPPALELDKIVAIFSIYLDSQANSPGWLKQFKGKSPVIGTQTTFSNVQTPQRSCRAKSTAIRNQLFVSTFISQNVLIKWF